MFILFDIGGTKMRLAASKDGKTFNTPVKIPTPKDDFEAGVQCFINGAKDLAGDKKINAIAGGVAGPLDKDKSMLINAPNMAGWSKKPLKARLKEALSCNNVFLENDTAMVGLGEAHDGAGKGAEIMAYVTVSTGVGGVRIVDGKIDRNRFGFEIGHHIVNMDEAEVECDICHERGHIESYISGTAFEKKYGKAAYEVHEDMAWEEAARELAVALNNVSVFWSPDAIVLGGSMIIGNPAIHIDRVKYYYDNVLKIFTEKPKIKKAELGDIGGIYGALAFLKQQAGHE